MSKREIMLDELIQYFEETASPLLLRRIKWQQAHDPGFRDELKEWEDFLHSHESKPVALAKIKRFHRQWHTPLPSRLHLTPTSLSPCKGKYVRKKKRSLFLSISSSISMLAVIVIILFSPSLTSCDSLTALA